LSDLVGLNTLMAACYLWIIPVLAHCFLFKSFHDDASWADFFCTLWRAHLVIAFNGYFDITK